jgi:hypothetical protein
MFAIATILLKKVAAYVFNHFMMIEVCWFIILFWLCTKIWPSSIDPSYAEYIRIFAVMASCVLFIYFSKFIHELFKNKYVKYKKNKEEFDNQKIIEVKILELLEHLSSKEEWIIKTMIANNKNNTMDIVTQVNWCDLDRLYEQGILCHRKVQDHTVLERKVDHFDDPILYEEFTPIRDYKMQDFVWEKVKSDPRWTSVSINKATEDDWPF